MDSWLTRKSKETWEAELKGGIKVALEMLERERLERLEQWKDDEEGLWLTDS